MIFEKQNKNIAEQAPKLRYRFFIFCILICEVWGFCRNGSEDEEVLRAKFHYSQAMVDGVVFKLDDDAYVKVSFLSITPLQPTYSSSFLFFYLFSELAA